MARIQAFTVALEHDVDENEAHNLSILFSHIKGVLSVKAEEVEPGDFIARERARKEIGSKLWDIVSS